MKIEYHSEYHTFTPAQVLYQIHLPGDVYILYNGKHIKIVKSEIIKLIETFDATLEMHTRLIKNTDDKYMDLLLFW